MTNRLLRELIAHVITELADMEAGFGKTKLVKLLYLIDVENCRVSRRTISGLKWIFYHYGPYAFEIDSLLDEMDLDIPQERFTTSKGHTAIVFNPVRELRPTLGKHISTSELRIVNRVVREWGETDLNDLLNHVYFYTEPMQHAERGDPLDFSIVQRRKVGRSADRIKLAPDRMAEYRERFRKAKLQRVRRPLSPPPRFDRVYQEAVDLMAAEERSEVPPRIVEIPEEVKKHFREDSKDGDYE